MIAGRELDALVAEKVMGLSVEVVCDRIGGCLKRMAQAYGCESHCKCDDMHPKIKPYSTDIAAAFQVVEKLASQGIRWSIGRRFDVHGVELEIGGDGVQQGTIIRTFGNTTPEAIAIAALKAVGYQEEVKHG